MNPDTPIGAWTWACGRCNWTTRPHRDLFTAQAERAHHIHTRHQPPLPHAKETAA